MSEKQKSKIYIAAAITVFIVIAFLAALGIKKVNISKDSSSNLLSQNEQNSEVQKKDTRLDETKALNSDTVAWITVPGTDIDNAVMQYTDNDYYLRRDEEKKDSVWGCYFADYYANMSEKKN